MTAPAAIHCLTPDAAFALARRVLESGAYDAEAIAAALDVLDASTNPTDRATVRWCRAYVQPVADMAQVDQDDLVAATVKKLHFTLYSLAVIGGIFGGVFMEAVITAWNGGAM